MAVKFIIDTGCDLDMQQAAELDVTLVPMTVCFGTDVFRAGVELTHEAFYQKLSEAKELPTTSQPTPYEFETAYQQVKDNGDEAVVLCVSSALSGTFQSASIAREGFEDCIYVVDTKTVSLAQRILLDYAVSLKKDGVSAKEIACALERKSADVCAYGAVDTLEYLIKGGRLSKAAGAVGSMLGVRPILCLSDGTLTVAGKARGPKAAITMTHNLITETGVDQSMPVAVGYTGNDPQVIETFMTAPNCIWSENKIPVYQVGSTVGTHTGPGLFITAFFKKS